jgi:hypothetical protein
MIENVSIGEIIMGVAKVLYFSKWSSQFQSSKAEGYDTDSQEGSNAGYDSVQAVGAKQGGFGWNLRSRIKATRLNLSRDVASLKKRHSANQMPWTRASRFNISEIQG